MKILYSFGFLLLISFLWLGWPKMNDHPGEDEERSSEAYAALQFIGSADAFPGVNVPSAAYGKAVDFYTANYVNVNASKVQQNVSWRSLGPLNVGGRTISIAIDPTDTATIWLGSASGGLWKSTTGGVGTNAWNYITTGFPVHGVAAIAINPSNHLEMYIGTGETYDYGTSVNGLVIRTTRGSHGIGILKSSDGGITWSQSLNWSYNQERTVWEILVNPLNPNTLYAATTEGIYKSIDAGVVWSQVFSQTMVMDIDMDPVDTTILYAGVGNLSSATKGLFKTSDAGASWTQLSNGLPAVQNTGRISVYVYKSNPNVVLAHITNDGNSVGLYRSVNKGVSWSLLSSNDFASYQGWYAKCLTTRSDDSSKILVGGVYLSLSTDDGAVFNEITNYTPGQINTKAWPDLHDIISNPLNPDMLYLLTDAGLYRSNDFGTSWYWCANGYNVSQFYHGSVSEQDSTVIIGGLQDRNTQSMGAGFNWNPIGGGDGTFNAIDPSNDFIQYSSSQYLNISSSTQGYIFTGSAPAFVAPFMLAPSNQFKIYAGDEYLNVSNDQGSTWSSSPLVDNFNPILSMDVSYTDEDKVYIGTAPTSTGTMGVFRTNNGGTSFTSISSGLPNRYPRDIAVDPADDNTVYIVFSGFGSGHIYKSVNAGVSWTDISSTLPDLPFHTIMVDPNNSNRIFAGCDLGVFGSADAGLSWQSLNAGFPEAVFVFDLEYSPANNSILAFTHGHGVYTISLGQLNVGLQDPVASSTIHQLKVYPAIFNEELTVSFYARQMGESTLDMYAINGQKVYSTVLQTKADLNEQRLTIPGKLQSGTYVIALRNGEGVYTAKVIKR